MCDRQQLETNIHKPRHTFHRAWALMLALLVGELAQRWVGSVVGLLLELNPSVARAPHG
jgi:hypothetical protein